MQTSTYCPSVVPLVPVYTLLTLYVAWMTILWLKTRSVGIPLLLKPWREFQNFSDTAISGRLIDLATCQYLELALCHYPQARLKTPVFERESWCLKTVFWYNLGYIVGFGLVEMAISTYPKLIRYIVTCTRIRTLCSKNPEQRQIKFEIKINTIRCILKLWHSRELISDHHLNPDTFHMKAISLWRLHFFT